MFTKIECVRRLKPLFQNPIYLSNTGETTETRSFLQGDTWSVLCVYGGSCSGILESVAKRVTND